MVEKKREQIRVIRVAVVLRTCVTRALKIVPVKFVCLINTMTQNTL
jgi:hypothetical protein